MELTLQSAAPPRALGGSIRRCTTCSRVRNLIGSRVHNLMRLFGVPRPRSFCLPAAISLHGHAARSCRDAASSLACWASAWLRRLIAGCCCCKPFGGPDMQSSAMCLPASCGPPLLFPLVRLCNQCAGEIECVSWGWTPALWSCGPSPGSSHFSCLVQAVPGVQSVGI